MHSKILSLNDSPEKKNDEKSYKCDIAKKSMKFLFSYWQYIIFLTIMIQTMLLIVKSIKDQDYQATIIIFRIFGFSLIISAVFLGYKMIGKKKFSFMFHDVLVLNYLIFMSILLVYLNFAKTEDAFLEGKNNFAFAYQFYYIAIFIPWMTMFNRKIKMLGISISEAILFSYLLWDDSMDTSERIRLIVFLIFKLIIYHKISQNNLIFFDSLDEMEKTTIEERAQWLRIMDDMSIGLIIIQKVSNNILFVNEIAKRILNVESVLDNSPEYFSNIDAKFGKLKFGKKSAALNETILTSCFKTIINLNHNLITKEFDSNSFLISELFGFLSEIIPKKGLSNNDEIIYLENEALSNRQLSIQVRLNFTLKQSPTYFLFIDENSIEKVAKQLDKQFEQEQEIFKYLSHELKTHLSSSIPTLEYGISSFSETEKVVSDSLIPALKSMKILHLMMSSIFDLDAIKQEQIVLDLDKINLKEHVFSLFSLLEPQSRQKGLKLSLQVEKNMNEIIHNDKQRTSIILFNLLSTTIKHAVQGEITVGISRLSNKKIKCSVTGNSQDLKEQTIRKMNSYFSQSISSFDLNEAGMSLDLLISNSLARILSDKDFSNQTGLSVELEFLPNSQQIMIFSFIMFDHNHLFVDRKVNKKVSVIILDASPKHHDLSSYGTIHSPLTSIIDEVDDIYKLKDTVRTTEVRNPLLPSSSRKNSRDSLVRNCICPPIMIIDDDPFNQLSLELILRNMDFKTKTANHGLEAISLLKKKKADDKCSETCGGFRIIFMDYQMPVMGGVEATIQIRELIEHGIIDNIIIIGCTAYGTRFEIEGFNEAGIDDLLLKPIDIRKIQQILTKWKI